MNSTVKLFKNKSYLKKLNFLTINKHYVTQKTFKLKKGPRSPTKS